MTKYYEMIKRQREERKESKKEDFFSLCFSHANEIKEEIAKDKTGENFITDMFRHQMNDTEYHINQWKEGLLEGLDITEDEFEKSEPLIKGFDIAEKLYLEGIEKFYNSCN